MWISNSKRHFIYGEGGVKPDLDKVKKRIQKFFEKKDEVHMIRILTYTGKEIYDSDSSDNLIVVFEISDWKVQGEYCENKDTVIDEVKLMNKARGKDFDEFGGSLKEITGMEANLMYKWKDTTRFEEWWMKDSIEQGKEELKKVRKEKPFKTKVEV